MYSGKSHTSNTEESDVTAKCSRKGCIKQDIVSNMKATLPVNNTHVHRQQELKTIMVVLNGSMGMVWDVIMNNLV